MFQGLIALEGRIEFIAKLKDNALTLAAVECMLSRSASAGVCLLKTFPNLDHFPG